VKIEEGYGMELKTSHPNSIYFAMDLNNSRIESPIFRVARCQREHCSPIFQAATIVLF